MDYDDEEEFDGDEEEYRESKEDDSPTEYLSDVDEFKEESDYLFARAIEVATETGYLVNTIADFTDCSHCQAEIQRMVDVLKLVVEGVENLRDNMPERRAIKKVNKETGRKLPFIRRLLGQI